MVERSGSSSLQKLKEEVRIELPKIEQTIEEIEALLFRRFRHVTHHGYALDLEWERMRMGLQEVRPVLEHFRRQVEQFLAGIEEEGSSS